MVWVISQSFGFQGPQHGGLSIAHFNFQRAKQMRLFGLRKYGV
jgi:hypothetical protein